MRRYIADSHIDVAARMVAKAGTDATPLEDLVSAAVEKAMESCNPVPPYSSGRGSEFDDEVNREVLRQQDLTETWVANLSAGISHRVTTSSSAQSSNPTSATGPDIAFCYKQVCQRCDPDLRAALKAAV